MLLRLRVSPGASGLRCPHASRGLPNRRVASSTLRAGSTQEARRDCGHVALSRQRRESQFACVDAVVRFWSDLLQRLCADVSAIGSTFSSNARGTFLLQTIALALSWAATFGLTSLIGGTLLFGTAGLPFVIGSSIGWTAGACFALAQQTQASLQSLLLYPELMRCVLPSEPRADCAASLSSSSTRHWQAGCRRRPRGRDGDVRRSGRPTTTPGTARSCAFSAAIGASVARCAALAASADDRRPSSPGPQRARPSTKLRPSGSRLSWGGTAPSRAG